MAIKNYEDVKVFDLKQLCKCLRQRRKERGEERFFLCRWPQLNGLQI